MTSFRERARAVKEAGVAERGNFTPTGAPLRVYQYWARQSSHVPARENFCHFWRVVAFWAPLMAAKNGVTRLFENMIFLAAVVAAAVAVLIFSAVTVGFWPVLLGVGSVFLFVVWVTFGIVAGAVRAETPIEYHGDPLLRTIFWVTLPISLPTWLIARPCFANPEKAKKVALITAFSLIGLGVAILLVIGLIEAWLAVGFWLLAIAAGIVVAAAAFYVGFAALATVIQGRRVLAKKKRENRPPREVEEFTPREPSKFALWLKARFSDLGDFVVFVAQVVRVKKWKICPIVEIEDKEVA